LIIGLKPGHRSEIHIYRLPRTRLVLANYKKKQISKQRLRGGNVTTFIHKKNESQNGGHIFVKATKLNSLEKTISALALNDVICADKLNPKEGLAKNNQLG